MYTLDRVIKEFKSIIKQHKKDKGISVTKDMTISYYEIIVEYLLLENKYQKEVELARKPIYIYFKYDLPRIDSGYFEFLYNVYNPVRRAVETFDSIEEIRNELNKK